MHRNGLRVLLCGLAVWSLGVGGRDSESGPGGKPAQSDSARTESAKPAQGDSARTQPAMPAKGNSARTQSATLTAPAAVSVPQDRIDAVNDLVQTFTDPVLAEQVSGFKELLSRAFGQGHLLREQYPGAPNLAEVRTAMLRIVDQADRLLKSDVPVEDKVWVDGLKMAILLENSASAAAKARQQIRGFVGRYENTAMEGLAVALGHGLAEHVGDAALKDELLKLMKAKYAACTEVRVYLKSIGKIEVPSFEGKEFVAELTRLDGSRLRLSDDLKGKVVVVHFWATWCGPCKAALPELRELYAKYKDKGLEIVSISFDEVRSALDSYLKENPLPWIITCSGKDMMSDPTAGKYYIDAVPGYWLVGPDGRIISSDARGKLDKLIPLALERLKASEETPVKP
ncbi:MAG: TlpA family protein disulfide reductase [Phycisphaerae bacterium]|nr:TlpA family protein disulfide reductase [Phycisphaerae bacterium]